MLQSALELKLIDPSKDIQVTARAVELIRQSLTDQEISELVESGYFGDFNLL